MRDPPGKKKRDGGSGRVKRVRRDSRNVKEIPRVIQSHNDHHQTPKYVD